MLFPPDTPLSASRVPYEESSVYSEQNFFSPSDFNKFQGIVSIFSPGLEVFSIPYGVIFTYP